MSRPNRDYQDYLEVLGFSPQLWGAQESKSDQGQANDWASLELRAKSCQACKLHTGRSHVVFGDGAKRADLMFVGEGPGADDDQKGIPFIGMAGQLLDKMIVAMGLSREEVYVSNVVKCRPPHNRNPEADEISACADILLSQIRLVNPKVIVALGTFSAQSLLKTDVAIAHLRGNFQNAPHLKRDDQSPIAIMPTFHPAYLLRSPEMKKPVWQDLQQVMRHLQLGS